MKAERLYCKNCLWESPNQNIGMKNSCPNCGSYLYVRFEDSLKWKEFSRIQCAEGLQETPETIERFDTWMESGNES